MGTTVTTNLALIKPDLNESIKQALPTFPGWAAQETANANKLDGLFRAQGITNAGVGFSAVGGGHTFGSGGGIFSKVIRIFPRMAINHFQIDMGTTGFAAGTGIYRVTGVGGPTASVDPAFAANFASGSNQGPAIGIATFYDSSAVATCSVFTVVYDIGNNVFVFRCPDGTLWSATNPVAAGQLDRLSAYCYYPTPDT